MPAKTVSVRRPADAQRPPGISCQRFLTPFSLAAALAGALALGIAPGCKSVEVTRSPGAKDARRLMVAGFSDEHCFRALRDYVLFGTAGYERPGILVARNVGRALQRRGVYEVVSESQARPVIVRTLKAKAVPRDDDWREAARTLNADGVLLGEVETYRSVWALFFHVSNVAFRARCLDVASGKELWQARVGGWRLYAMEEDLLAKRSHELCYELIVERP